MKSILFAISFAALMAASTVTADDVKTFSTPEKAVDAFIGAVRANNLDKLQSIFGKEAQDLVVTEDPVADEKARRDFLERYDAKHQLTKQADGSQLLVVGNDSWPMPVPLVKSGNKWKFDAPRGFEEVVNRRVGENELSAMQTCLAIGDAQRDYYHEDRDGDGVLEYAQSFRSTIGLHNGLYWPSNPGEPLSPLGQFVATATEEGYTAASNSYHGYHFRLVRSQGPSAIGGAYDYMVRDDQIGGFAVIAYPTEYGDSGVMTFMVSHSGVLYQRDLGPSTEAEVWKIETFEPGEGWTAVPPNDLELASRL